MKKLVTSTLAGASAAAFAVALSLSSAALAGEEDPDKKMGASGVKLMAELTGAAEVPGPGDADGSGIFKARLNPGSGQMCYELRVDDIDDVTGAHIHFGTADVAGGVVVALEDPDDGKADACLTIDGELARKIIRDPSQYYVNVHDTEFPQGAVRGQLMK